MLTESESYLDKSAVPKAGKEAKKRKAISFECTAKMKTKFQEGIHFIWELVAPVVLYPL